MEYVLFPERKMVKMAMFGKAVIRHLSPSLIATADSVDFEIEAVELRTRKEGDVEAQKAAKIELERGLQRFNDQAPVGVVKGVKGTGSVQGVKGVKGLKEVDADGVVWAKPLAGLDAWDKVPEIVAPKIRGRGLVNSNNNNNARDETVSGRVLRSNTSSLYGSASSLDAINNNNNTNNIINRTRTRAQVHASCGNLATVGKNRAKKPRRGSVGSLNDLSLSSVCSSTQVGDDAIDR